MTKSNEAPFFNFARKFSSALDSLQPNSPPTKQIMSFLEQSKTICDVDNVITSITNDLPETLLKHLFEDNLKPYIIQSPDPTLTLPCIDFFVRSLATISKITPDPLIWQKTFIQFVIQNPFKAEISCFDQFIETLKQFKTNMKPSFWWKILCSSPTCEYLDKLRAFAEAFLISSEEQKTPMEKVIDCEYKNTVLNAFQLLRSVTNIEVRNKFTRSLLIPSFNITVDCVSKSGSAPYLFKAKFYPPKSGKKDAVNILNIIRELGEESLSDILRYFTLLVNNFERPQIGQLNVNNEWLIETLRLRKILRIIYQIVPDATSLFQSTIDNLAQLSVKQMITFAVQFDVQKNDFIISHCKDPQWNSSIINYIGHLSIVFAPIFFNLDKSIAEARCTELKNRNKRMKVQKTDDLLENLDEIYSDPLLFEQRIDNSEPSFLRMNLHYKQNSVSWDYNSALNHVEQIIKASGHESECLVIFSRRFSLAQKRLINTFPEINHKFLSEKFLGSCLDELTLYKLASSRNIVESSAITDDLTEEQRLKYVSNIYEGLKSSDVNIQNAASESVMFALTHILPASFKLCEPFLNLPRFDSILNNSNKTSHNHQIYVENIRIVTSIFSIVYQTKDLENRDSILGKLFKLLQKFVSNEPRDEVMISSITTILFEELMSDSDQVSDGVKNIFIAFFSKKDDSPDSPLRMLSLYQNHYKLIAQKFPGFFEKLVIVIKELLKNKKTDKNIFQILSDTLVDILLKREDGWKILYQIKEEILPTLSSEANIKPPSKYELLCFSIDRFMSKYNHPLTESEPEPFDANNPNNHSYILVDQISLEQILYHSNEANISSKTKNGSAVYNIKAIPPDIEDVNVPLSSSESVNDQKLEPIQGEETEFSKAFSSFVDEFSTSVPCDSSSQGNQPQHESTMAAPKLSVPPSSPPPAINSPEVDWTTKSRETFHGWHDCTPGDFMHPPTGVNEPKNLPSETFKQARKPRSQYRKRYSTTMIKIDPFSDSKVLYNSPDATSFYTSLYNNISNSLTDNNFVRFRAANGILDLAASSLFQHTIRETVKIGLLFVKKWQTDQKKILQNSWKKDISDGFRSFVSSLGSIVDLATHKGFNGKLDTSLTNFSNGRYHLYYSNEQYEMMFHTAPLLPTDLNDEQQIYKKRHIGNDNVHIIWTEHIFDYDTTTITSQFNDAHIIIYPIHGTSEFFRVTVHRKERPENEVQMKFGPLLLGETVVSRHALPDLVRYTALYADRIAREYALPDTLFVSSMGDILANK